MRVLLVAIGLGAVLAAASCTQIPDAGSRKFSVFPDGGDTGGNGGGGSGGQGGGGQGGGGATSCDLAACSGDQVGTFGQLTACCADHGAPATGGTGCGLNLGPLTFPNICEAVGQKGPDNANCPDVPFGADTFDGCCRVDPSIATTGFCGMKMGPLGCVAPEDVDLAPGGPCNCGSPVGTICTYNSDCCDTSPNETGAACVKFSGANEYSCTLNCTTNAECPSQCCILLDNGRGACGDTAAQCTFGARTENEVCDSDAECQVGLVCVTQFVTPFGDGPKLCRATCDPAAPIITDGGSNPGSCPTGQYCIQDATSLEYACSRPDASLCSDTCTLFTDPFTGQGWGHNNGTCDDGSRGGAIHCAYGTDCADCGAHLGGQEVCSDGCDGTPDDTICEDSGPGSVGPSGGTLCYWGTDCSDCGPRRKVCTNTCLTANNGTCDYDSGGCALGTDCADCNYFYGTGGGPKDLCDGSTGQICTGEKLNAETYGGDGACQCPDCGWDAGDCLPGGPLIGAQQYGLRCNGVAISGCCAAAGDVCGPDLHALDSDYPGMANDGFCDCGGWCGWETDCAYSPIKTVSTTLLCNQGFGSTCDLMLSPYNLPYQSDGFCDCLGACSWEKDCNNYGYVCQDTCGTVAGDTGSFGNFVCEDGVAGASSGCGYGTDCADCGARPGISP